jgi:uncharacterized phage-associated protein
MPVRQSRVRAARVRTFDPQKALEAVLLVSSSLRDPTFHSVSKLLYFADRLHLQRYGRTICGDDYVAMKHGPVPSRIYNMMKVPTGREEYGDVEAICSALGVKNNHHIEALRAPDTDVLSSSEMECLQDAIKRYGRKSFKELTSLSHDDAWKTVGDNEYISLEAIAKTLPNADEVLEALQA